MRMCKKKSRDMILQYIESQKKAAITGENYIVSYYNYSTDKTQELYSSGEIVGCCEFYCETTFRLIGIMALFEKYSVCTTHRNEVLITETYTSELPDKDYFLYIDIPLEMQLTWLNRILDNIDKSKYTELYHSICNKQIRVQNLLR